MSQGRCQEEEEERGKREKAKNRCCFSRWGICQKWRHANRILSFFVSQTWRFFIHGGVARGNQRYSSEIYRATQKEEEEGVVISSELWRKKRESREGNFWQYTQRKPRYNVKKGSIFQSEFFRDTVFNGRPFIIAWELLVLCLGKEATTLRFCRLQVPEKGDFVGSRRKRRGGKRGNPSTSLRPFSSTCSCREKSRLHDLGMEILTLLSELFFKKILHSKRYVWAVYCLR